MIFDYNGFLSIANDPFVIIIKQLIFKFIILTPTNLCDYFFFW